MKEAYLIFHCDFQKVSFALVLVQRLLLKWGVGVGSIFHDVCHFLEEDLVLSLNFVKSFLLREQFLTFYILLFLCFGARSQNFKSGWLSEINARLDTSQLSLMQLQLLLLPSLG